MARDAWTGTVPNTTAQQVIQGYITTASQAWSGTLTEAQRQQWRDVAMGLTRVSRGMVKYIPTGYQYYMEVNMIRQRIGLAILTTPHEFIPGGSIAEVVLSWDGVLFRVLIKLTEVFNAAASNMRVDVFRAGPYDNGGRRAIEPEYRFLKMWQNLVNGYDDTAATSKYYWYKVRWLWDFGAAGNWFERQIYTG